MKTPKHLQDFSPENLARIKKGFNSFVFGFAAPGEVLELETGKLEFVGNFSKKKDAEAKKP